MHNTIIIKILAVKVNKPKTYKNCIPRMENQGRSLARSKKGIKIKVLGPPTSKTHNLAGEIGFFAWCCLLTDLKKLLARHKAERTYFLWRVVEEKISLGRFVSSSKCVFKGRGFYIRCWGLKSHQDR